MKDGGGGDRLDVWRPRGEITVRSDSEGLDTLRIRQPALRRPRCTCCFSGARRTEEGRPGKEG